MINFQRELLSISKSISELAAQLETMANDIDGNRVKGKRARPLSSAKVAPPTPADDNPATMLKAG